MKLNKKYIQILTISSILSLLPIASYAANDITITPFTIEEEGWWKPGRVESENFYINNNKGKDIRIDRLYISLKSSKHWKTGEELDINSKQFKQLAKYTKVTLKHNDNVLFENTLANILLKDEILLLKEIYIKANNKEELSMTIDMNSEMNNDAQAIDNVFNIGLAYKMDTDEPPIWPPIVPEPPVEPPIVPELPVNPPVEPPINPNPPITPDDNISGGGRDKLPQTGGIINGASLAVLGAVAIGAGIVLNRKSDQEGGGKEDE